MLLPVLWGSLVFAEGFGHPGDTEAGGRVGTQPLATGMGGLGPACQGSPGAGGAQPQRQALPPAPSCPRSLHVAELPPMGGRPTPLPRFPPRVCGAEVPRQLPAAAGAVGGPWVPVPTGHMGRD